jgi:eukaryotic translation initiation factor 2C
VLLPPEVCEILPNQAFGGKLLEQHTAAMIEIAAKPPNVNASAIVDEGLKLLGFAGASSVRSKLGVSIQPEMAVVPGRILKSPGLQYGQGSKTPEIDERAGWNLRNIKFAFGGRLDNWLVLVIRDGKNKEFQLGDPGLKPTIKGFVEMCRTSGIQVPQGAGEPKYAQVDLPPKALPSDPLRERAIEAIRTAVGNQKPKLALVLLADGDKHIYSGIKRLFDTQLDIGKCSFLFKRVCLVLQPPYVSTPAKLGKVGIVNLNFVGITNANESEQAGRSTSRMLR